jgi:hypothetical protein
VLTLVLMVPFCDPALLLLPLLLVVAGEAAVGTRCCPWGAACAGLEYCNTHKTTNVSHNW